MIVRLGRFRRLKAAQWGWDRRRNGVRVEINPSPAELSGDHATYDAAELEANVIEVAQALQVRYGDAGPTPEQEKEFMREWLVGKGRSKEEVDSILDS